MTPDYKSGAKAGIDHFQQQQKELHVISQSQFTILLNKIKLTHQNCLLPSLRLYKWTLLLNTMVTFGDQSCSISNVMSNLNEIKATFETSIILMGAFLIWLLLRTSFSTYTRRLHKASQPDVASFNTNKAFREGQRIQWLHTEHTEVMLFLSVERKKSKP